MLRTGLETNMTKSKVKHTDKRRELKRKQEIRHNQHQAKPNH